MVKYVDMLSDIYKYEFLTNVNESDRTVEYIPSVKMYKTLLTNDLVKQRYFEIKNKLDEMENSEADELDELEIMEDITEKENDKTIVPEPNDLQVQVLKELSIKDSKIFVEKVKNKSSDKAFFSHKNIENALLNYHKVKSDKAIGYVYDDISYYILKKQKQDMYSEVVEKQSDSIDYFHSYYEELIVNRMKEMEEEEILRIKEEEETSRRAEELHINPDFKKKFNRILKKEYLKCISNQNFSAFDFRQIDLNNIFFFNCIFDNADFTDLVIDNTVFIECSFVNTNNDGTVFENCRKIKCISNTSKPL